MMHGGKKHQIMSEMLLKILVS